MAQIPVYMSSLISLCTSDSVRSFHSNWASLFLLYLLLPMLEPLYSWCHSSNGLAKIVGVISAYLFDTWHALIFLILITRLESSRSALLMAQSKELTSRLDSWSPSNWPPCVRSVLAPQSLHRSSQNISLFRSSPYSLKGLTQSGLALSSAPCLNLTADLTPAAWLTVCR